jgi:acid phosphatase family membrane protein YuiD
VGVKIDAKGLPWLGTLSEQGLRVIGIDALSRRAIHIQQELRVGGIPSVKSSGVTAVALNQ